MLRNETTLLKGSTLIMRKYKYANSKKENKLYIKLYGNVSINQGRLRNAKIVGFKKCYKLSTKKENFNHVSFK